MSARRGVFLILTLITVGVLVSVGALVLLAFLGGAPPAVPSRATLTLRIDAPFNEIDPPDVLSQFLPRSSTLRSTIDLSRRAKVDSRIQTVVFRPSASGALWAQLQEVRAALDDFKTSKKPLTAFLESGGAGENYLASAAHKQQHKPARQLGD